MEATQQSTALGYTDTISKERWNSLHSIEELDEALKSIIHRHFHKQ